MLGFWKGWNNQERFYANLQRKKNMGFLRRGNSRKSQRKTSLHVQIWTIYGLRLVCSLRGEILNCSILPADYFSRQAKPLLLVLLTLAIGIWRPCCKVLAWNAKIKNCSTKLSSKKFKKIDLSFWINIFERPKRAV